jgi:hypothetical protein
LLLPLILHRLNLGRENLRLILRVSTQQGIEEVAGICDVALAHCGGEITDVSRARHVSRERRI